MRRSTEGDRHEPSHTARRDKLRRCRDNEVDGEDRAFIDARIMMLEDQINEQDEPRPVHECLMEARETSSHAKKTELKGHVLAVERAEQSLIEHAETQREHQALQQEFAGGFNFRQKQRPSQSQLAHSLLSNFPVQMKSTTGPAVISPQQMTELWESVGALSCQQFQITEHKHILCLIKVRNLV